jgi:hypothetical protein
VFNFEVMTMMKQMKHLRWVAIGLILVFLSACISETPVDLSMAPTYAAQTLAAMVTETEEPTQEPATATPTEGFTATPVPVSGPVGPFDFPENVNPLTGLILEDPSILDRRPVLVKVANYPVSGRPHAGLSFADMVFEYYIGYGGNRFVGLYYGQNSDMIGPVRSGRLVDPYLTSLYEGVLGMEGAYVTVWEHIVDILGNRAISGKDLCPGICDDGRGLVISVFADSEALTEITSNRGVVNERYLLEGMAFDTESPQGGEVADLVKIEFSNVNPGEWRYDQESGKYLRWIDNETGQPIDMIPLVDRITDEQLAFSNVAVIFTHIDEIALTLHDMDIWDNTQGERAVVFRDGKGYDITWQTPSRTQPIQFIDEAGEIFKLKPGNTWVIIFGLNSVVTMDEGSWTFDFFMP